MPEFGSRLVTVKTQALLHSCTEAALPQHFQQRSQTDGQRKHFPNKKKRKREKIKKDIGSGFRKKKLKTKSTMIWAQKKN